MKDIINKIAKDSFLRAVEHRRYLHMNPEISYHEFNTQRYIISVLNEHNIEYDTFPTCCAVIAHIKGGHPGKRIAIRADMDALELNEQTGVVFESKNPGVMHACGHDGHIAALLTFAEIKIKYVDSLYGEIVLIFQHAEEIFPGGARELIDFGVLNGVDAVFGIHLWPSFETGVVAYSHDVLMAAADSFLTTFYSSGGHGSEPHKTNNVIYAASTFVIQLQSIMNSIKPSTEPGVLSVCQFQSGNTFNIIPCSAVIGGTIRTCTENTRLSVFDKLHKISESVANIYEVSTKQEIIKGQPALINNSIMVSKVIDIISNFTHINAIECKPVMAGEDFSRYLKEKQGAYFFVGCKNTEYSDRLHSSKYMIDENALSVVLELFLSICVGFSILKLT